MTVLDWLALTLFLLSWLGYGPLLDALARRNGTLNQDMLRVRQVWMQAMAHREIRLVDSQLLGHSINSAGFLASTNLLLIAAVASILFGGENALRGLAEVGAEDTSLKVLEIKLALILVCLSRGLLDFIWSIRQMNYALAIIGATPELHRRADREALGQAAADLLNPALSAFSQGVRGYYFSLAAAAWMFGPLWLATGVIAAFSLMVWRQSASPAAKAIRAARRLLDQAAAGGPDDKRNDA
jgi:Predicted membrane protein